MFSPVLTIVEGLRLPNLLAKAQMSWFILAGLTAFIEACKDLFAKRATKDLESQQLAFATVVLILPFFALPQIWSALFQPAASISTNSSTFADQLIALDSPFFISLIVATALHFAVMLLYMRAISTSPLSATLPMVSLTPLFLLLTAPIILGQYPSTQGIVGVVFIVLGAYLLNITDRKHGLFAPFKSLITDPGTRDMLLVAFLWSITATIDPIGIGHSNKSIWVTTLFTLLSLTLAIYIGPRKALQALTSFPAVAAGLLNGLSLYFYIEAIALGPVPYVIAIKRLSVLIGICFAALIFKEIRIKERLLGAAVMVLGVATIALASQAR